MPCTAQGLLDVSTSGECGAVVTSPIDVADFCRTACYAVLGPFMDRCQGELPWYSTASLSSLIGLIPGCEAEARRQVVPSVSLSHCDDVVGFSVWSGRATSECCDEPDEVCSAGRVTRCDADCAEVMRQMQDACQAYLLRAKLPSAVLTPIADAFELCSRTAPCVFEPCHNGGVCEDSDSAGHRRAMLHALSLPSSSGAASGPLAPRRVQERADDSSYACTCMEGFVGATCDDPAVAPVEPPPPPPPPPSSEMETQSALMQVKVRPACSATRGASTVGPPPYKHWAVGGHACCTDRIPRLDCRCCILHADDGAYTRDDGGGGTCVFLFFFQK